MDTTSLDHHRHTRRCWWDHEQARWVCSADTLAETSEPTESRDGTDADGVSPGAALVDVRDMLVVHTAMLREFRLAPAAVRRTGSGDTKQASTVADHLLFLLDMLHHHHAGEDALLWPTLRERTPPSALAAIEAVEAQHVEIDASLGRVRGLRETWAGDPTAGNRERLADELSRLHTMLAEHLDLEERALLPLAASVLSAQEWHAVGEAAVAAMPKSALVLSFGMFAYEGEPAVLADMLSAAPAPARVLLPRIAPRVYARRARRVHGTARP